MGLHARLIIIHKILSNKSNLGFYLHNRRMDMWHILANIWRLMHDSSPSKVTQAASIPFTAKLQCVAIWGHETDERNDDDLSDVTALVGFEVKLTCFVKYCRIVRFLLRRKIWP